MAVAAGSLSVVALLIDRCTTVPPLIGEDSPYSIAMKLGFESMAARILTRVRTGHLKILHAPSYNSRHYGPFEVLVKRVESTGGWPSSSTKQLEQLDSARCNIERLNAADMNSEMFLSRLDRPYIVTDVLSSELPIWSMWHMQSFQTSGLLDAQVTCLLSLCIREMRAQVGKCV